MEASYWNVKAIVSLISEGRIEPKQLDFLRRVSNSLGQTHKALDAAINKRG